MKFFTTILFFAISIGLSGQNDKDYNNLRKYDSRTKFRAKLDLIKLCFKNCGEPPYENWEFTNIAFQRKPEEIFTSGIDLVSTRRTLYPFAQFLLKPIVLFKLDTNWVPKEYHEPYYYYYANPEYFENLKTINAHRVDPGTYTVGVFKKALLKTGIQYKDIPPLLIKTIVIDTYDHLNANLTLTSETNTKYIYEVKYHVIWHICTSTCYHPEYDMSVKIDKEKYTIELIKY